MFSTPRLAAASCRKFDIIIIGGGIQGAGIAREASLRGWNVALFEKGDFASGTSGKTSSLIHGGIRYLEQGEIQLVREAVGERWILSHMAPYLVTPLPFLFPIYQGGPRKKITIQIGMLLYDLLTGQKSFGRSTFLPPDVVQQREPSLASYGLQGAFRFFDAQMDDARLCLAVLLSAQKRGAAIFNYTPVTRLLQDHGKVCGVTVQEGGCSYDIYGTVVVNATGSWSDRLCNMEQGNPRTQNIRATKGIHLVLPKITHQHAVVLSSPTSKRIFFVIPWRGYSLVGTTDTDYADDLDHVVPADEEVASLIEETAPFFPSLVKDKVLGKFAALRPLVRGKTQNPWDQSRREQIEWTPGGMLVVRGGKFTLFRKIAIRVMDAVHARYPQMHNLATHDSESLLHGGETGPIEAYCHAEIEKSSLPQPLLASLINTYGTYYKAVLEMADRDPSLLRPLTPLGSPLAVDAIYAVRCEHARHLSDFMLRRTRLAHGPYGTDMSVIRAVAESMGKAMGWNTEEREQECNAYLAEVAF